MKNYKPFFVILALAVAMSLLFIVDNYKNTADSRDELLVKVRYLEKRNEELYQQIEALHDQNDDCQHDLQDCLRTREGQAITDATKY